MTTARHVLSHPECHWDSPTLIRLLKEEVERGDRLEAGRKEAYEALDSLWAAIGDRLLAKGAAVQRIRQQRFAED